MFPRKKENRPQTEDTKDKSQSLLIRSYVSEGRNAQSRIKIKRVSIPSNQVICFRVMLAAKGNVVYFESQSLLIRSYVSEAPKTIQQQPISSSQSLLIRSYVSERFFIFRISWDIYCVSIPSNQVICFRGTVNVANASVTPSLNPF